MKVFVLEKSTDNSFIVRAGVYMAHILMSVSILWCDLWKFTAFFSCEMEPRSSAKCEERAYSVEEASRGGQEEMNKSNECA